MLSVTLPVGITLNALLVGDGGEIRMGVGSMVYLGGLCYCVDLGMEIRGWL